MARQLASMAIHDGTDEHGRELIEDDSSSSKRDKSSSISNSNGKGSSGRRAHAVHQIDDEDDAEDDDNDAEREQEDERGAAAAAADEHNQSAEEIERYIRLSSCANSHCSLSLSQHVLSKCAGSVGGRAEAHTESAAQTEAIR